MQQLGNRSEGAVLRGELVPLRVMGEPGSDVFQARSTDGRDVVVRFWRSLTELEVRNAIELASRARGVRHPMLASVFGIREHGEGTLSLISEYVTGRTLDAWVADVGLPPLRMSVDFVRRLALGLDAAVQRGVPHHAVYPGNIFVAEPDTRPQGRIVAKLADLGVARPRQALRFEVAHFLAPEELVARLERGGVRVPVTASMNVYACGCLLHYLCTGQPPLQSDSLAGLTGLHAAGAIAVPSQVNRDIPEYLERVIAQSLERDPKRRIANPGALAASLSHVESVWRSSSVQKKSRVPPPPPPAAKRESVSQIPAFDLVLRPRAATEPRSSVVAKAAEPVGRTTMRGVPQLFQRPAKQAEPPFEGRTTLVGGFGPDGKPMDRSVVSPEHAVPASDRPGLSSERAESVSVRAAAVRQRIATERGFAAVSSASAASASNRPASVQDRRFATNEPADAASERTASSTDRTAVVPEPAASASAQAAALFKPSESASDRFTATQQPVESSSESATHVFEPPAAPSDRVAAARSEGAAAAVSDVEVVAASEDATVSRSEDAAVSRSEDVAVATSEGAAVVGRKRGTGAMSDRLAMPAWNGRRPLASQQGATTVKPVPPRALGWPFAVPVPPAFAESASVEAVAGSELKSGLDSKLETDAKLAPTAKVEQSAKLTDGPSRAFGRPPSMFGRPTAGAVVPPQTEASAASQSNARTETPAEPVRQQPPRLPSLRDRIAQRTPKRELESTATVAAKLSAAILDTLEIPSLRSAQVSVADPIDVSQYSAPSTATGSLPKSPISPSPAIEVAVVLSANDAAPISELASSDAETSIAPVSPSEVAPTSELTTETEIEPSNASVSTGEATLSSEPASLSEAVSANSVEQLSPVAATSALDLSGATAKAESAELMVAMSQDEVAPTGDFASTLDVETSDVVASPNEAVSTHSLSLATIDSIEVASGHVFSGASALAAGDDEVASVVIVEGPDLDSDSRSDMVVDGDVGSDIAAAPSDESVGTDVASSLPESGDDSALLETELQPKAASSIVDAEGIAARTGAAAAVSGPAVARGLASASSASAPAPARRRFDSTSPYGRELIVPLVDPGVLSSEPDSDDSFFDPHETTTAVGGAFFIPPAAPEPRRSASVPPPLPVWNAPDSSASIVVNSAPLARHARAELVTPVVAPRDSLSPYELSARESSVSPREDFVFGSLHPRPRTMRRWPWFAAAGVGLGAYVSLLALQNNPPEHHAASRPNTEPAIEIVRAEGQAFPITPNWQPAFEPTLELASTPDPEPAAPPRERVRAQSDTAEPSKPSRATLRKADQLLDAMQVSREQLAVHPRAATREPAREPAIVNVPSAVSPAVVQGVQGRVPVSPKPVVFGELWATPSVVQAGDLRPTTTPNTKVAQPSQQVRVIDTPPPAAARTENLEVRGSLSDQTVRRAIDRLRPQLNECFVQHGAGNAAATTARVELTIDETGRTRDARVHGAAGALDECLVQASRKLVAGAPDTGTVKVAWNVRYGR